MDNKEKSLQAYLHRFNCKMRYVGELIAATPKYGWIILLQIASGFMSFAGLPLLVPVLDYLQNDSVVVAQDKNVQMLGGILEHLGVSANFHSVLIVAFALIIAAQCLTLFSTLLATWARIDLSEKYRRDIFQAYGAARWLWLVDTRSGAMNYAVIREADLASDAHLNAQRVLIYAVQVLVLISITLQLSMPITLIAIGFYGCLSFMNLFNSRKVRRLGDAYNQSFRKLSNELVVLQQNKKFFKASPANHKTIKSIFALLTNITSITKSQTLRMELQNSWNFILSLAFLVGMLLFHKQLALTYSELLLIFLVFMRIGPNFNWFSSSFLTLDGQIPIHIAFTQRLKEFQQHKEPSGAKEFVEGTPISFENVTFIYPNGTHVFEDLNIVIRPNQTTAFVGSSGVGKSTLLDLILRLLDPTSGKILYGHILHEELERGSLRNKIAYVSQETTLIDGTLKENITVTAPFVDDEKLHEVIRKVALEQTINDLPEGLATPVGENGIKLSGGQRQRVALARALLMDPKILILDEATSSLDAQSEILIQETIKELKKDFTIIIVTHKVSAVRFADTIYVLDKGRAVESGTYDELLAQKGQLYFYDSLQR